MYNLIMPENLLRWYDQITDMPIEVVYTYEDYIASSKILIERQHRSVLEDFKARFAVYFMTQLDKGPSYMEQSVPVTITIP